MTKEQVMYLRDEVYKDKPVIVVLDNEHNFMDNYPGRCFPIWDDDKEIVTFVETNQESSGMTSSDFPYMIAVASYDFIQSFRFLSDMETVIGIFKDNKAKLGDGKYDYNIKCISTGARNTRPAHKPYYEQ